MATRKDAGASPQHPKAAAEPARLREHDDPAQREHPKPVAGTVGLEERIRQLEEERNRLKADVKEFQDRFLRARADYENYARRAARETQDAVRALRSGLLLRLIDATEDLEKALAHLKGAGAETKALQLVLDQFRKLLKDEGVRPVETRDVPFNYRYHTAVERTPTAEHPEGTILEVYQKGYFIEDTILRPATVRVATPATKVGTGSPAGTTG